MADTGNDPRERTSIPNRASVPDMTRAQLVTLAMSGIFLLVGVLGFIPGITSNYGRLAFASHHSGALLLGLFQVSVLHNLVHLIFGLFGLGAVRHHHRAWRYLLLGGCVYFALAGYGLIVKLASTANVIPVNAADNWLHLGLATIMIISGLVTRRVPAEPPRETSAE
ncbi:DUF4383 domain-containing protein [Microlunatus soli]|uniref:DUF4383 domain-containing protein n=1 Tax=Microlunatus soli TaxID=630515 RepID=A0A1H1N9A3_9ACTN|nr:DUF4383 domain-containing protein [Microlunatus soli]SDR95572.1 protein of unknown function [Microlunatus soli]